MASSIAEANMPWTEKYGPQELEHFALGQALKDGLATAPLSQHLILYGPPGGGKTRAATVMCRQSNSDYLLVNSAARGTIDYLKGAVSEFASTMSLDQTFKTVIYDDADALSFNTQHMLLGSLEYFQGHTRFIFTTNNPTLLLEPIRSRCTSYDFTVKPEDKSELIKLSESVCCGILSAERIQFKEEHVRRLIRRYFPDQRQIIHQLEVRSATGVFRAESLAEERALDFNFLFDCLARRQLGDMKRWVAVNRQQASFVIAQLYDVCDSRLALESAGEFVVVLAQYEQQVLGSARPEIALTAMLAEMMERCRFED